MWTAETKETPGQRGVLGGDELVTSRDVVPSQSPARDAAGSGARLAWLDVLRGLAALAVVFDHASYYVLHHVRGIVYQWFDPGNYGVFVFFIISGYSRNSLLTQNVRTLPLRSSDAGTMYPLMMKKTKTP